MYAYALLSGTMMSQAARVTQRVTCCSRWQRMVNLQGSTHIRTAPAASGQCMSTLCNKSKPDSCAPLPLCLPHYNRAASRTFSNSMLSWFSSSDKSNLPTDWNKAVSEAEKIVGYPTSFMSLRCFLSDELSNVALQMRKLVGSKHPLLQTARRFLYDGKESTQTRGLMVLLVSKAAGPGEKKNDDDVIENMVSGIYPRQRMLAEITELIHMASLIHKGVMEVHEIEVAESPSDMHSGNKMAVLSGDFLLANASKGLADLQNTYVVEMIAKSIGDIALAEFTCLHDSNGYSTLSETCKMTDWERHAFLSSGSLLANSCQAALLLANHNKDLQDRAYQFGECMAYAHQMHEDLLPFLKGLDDKSAFNIASAPVILYREHNHDKCLEELFGERPWNMTQVFNIIHQSDAIDRAREQCRKYGQQASESLQIFKNSDAKDALSRIVTATLTV